MKQDTSFFIYRSAVSTANREIAYLQFIYKVVTYKLLISLYMDREHKTRSFTIVNSSLTKVSRP